MNALLMLAGLALAKQLPHALSPGTYIFETNARNDKGPICTERWELRADRTMTVRGGEEVVEKTYKLTHDRDGDWITSTSVSTNGKPDCTGTVTKHVVKIPNSRLVVAFNSGPIAVCPPPGHAPDGAPYVSDCFATLKRVE